MKIKEKRKFLKSIYQIQKTFNTTFGNVSRNFSFGLVPDSKQKELLEKWFTQVVEVKKTLYLEIYKDFKLTPNKYLNNAFDYSTFFKGKPILNLMKKDKDVITYEPVMDGLTMEINGSLRSYITNHKRLFEENIANLKILMEIINKNREAIKQVNKVLDDNDILALARKVINENYEALVNNFKCLSEHESLIVSFNLLAGTYNYKINQFNSGLKLRLNFLDFLTSLPTFPSVTEQHKFILKDLLLELNNFANNKVDNNLLIDFLTKVFQKRINHNKQTITRYEDRLIFWILNKYRGEINKSIASEFNTKLTNKILQLENHFTKKPFDAGNRNTYLDLLGFKARLINPKKLVEINSINSEIKGLYLHGKEEIQIITMPGFSWSKQEKGKPLKNIAFAIKNENNKQKLFICMASSVKPFILDKNGELEFLKTTGGQKRKNRQPKSINYIKGNFLTENCEGLPIMMQLHFGKSYSRRYLFQKNWGLFSKSPNIFLNNARLKRVKKKPGDPFKYYFDITLSGEKVYGYKDFTKEILKKTECIIGIDRGEVKPIAYSVVRIRDGSVIEKGFLAQSYIANLLDYNERKRKAQKIGRVPQYLKSKIIRVQETMLETAASEILSLVSKYNALVAIENLNSNFKGIEHSIIPKKTYKKAETLIFNALEIAGFARKDDRGNYWGGIMTVFPAGTSQTCIECRTRWDSKLKQEIIDYSSTNNFANIDLTDNSLEFKEEKLKLNENFFVYNFQNKLNERKDLNDFKRAVENKELEKAIKLLRLAVGPRIRQDTFICPKCSYQENADLLGATNIARKAIENRERLLKL